MILWMIIFLRFDKKNLLQFFSKFKDFVKDFLTKIISDVNTVMGVKICLFFYIRLFSFYNFWTTLNGGIIASLAFFDYATYYVD